MSNSEEKNEEKSKPAVFNEKGEERTIVDILSDLETNLDSEKVAFFAKKTKILSKVNYFSEFGVTLDDARTLIDETLEAANIEAPGFRTILIRLWKEAHAGPKKAEKKPEKEFDKAELPELHGTDIEGLEISFDDPEFPTGERVDLEISTELPDVSTFTVLDWAKLARRTWMCNELNLDMAYSETNPTDTTSAQPPAYTFKFYWPSKTKRNSARIRLVNSAQTTSRSFYSAQERGAVQNLIQSGGGSISGDYQGNGGSAAFDYSYYYRLAKKSGRRELHVAVSRQQFFVELDTTSLLKPSDQFKEAVDAVLSIGKTEDDDTLDKRFEALQKVFETYGHIAPSRVTLGGALYYTFSKTVTARVTDEQVEEVAQAAAEAHGKPYGADVQAEGHGSHEDANGDTFSAQSIRQEMSWTNIGGGPRTIENSNAWLNSLSDPNLWRVVKRDGLRMVTDWLDDDTRDKVNALLQRGRKKLWDNRPLPADVAFPPMMYSPSLFPKANVPGLDLAPMSRVPFFISSWPDANSPVLSSRHETVEEIHQNKIDDVGSRGGMPAIANWPVMNNKNTRADHRWSLIYTGETTGAYGQNGLPIFWIVSYLGRDLDKKIRIGDDIDHRCLALSAPIHHPRQARLHDEDKMIHVRPFSWVFDRFKENNEALSDVIKACCWVVVPDVPKPGQNDNDYMNRTYRIISQTGHELTANTPQIPGSRLPDGTVNHSLAVEKGHWQRTPAKVPVHLIPRPDLV